MIEKASIDEVYIDVTALVDEELQVRQNTLIPVSGLACDVSALSALERHVSLR